MKYTRLDFSALKSNFGVQARCLHCDVESAFVPYVHSTMTLPRMPEDVGMELAIETVRHTKNCVLAMSWDVLHPEYKRDDFELYKPTADGQTRITCNHCDGHYWHDSVSVAIASVHHTSDCALMRASNRAAR